MHLAVMQPYLFPYLGYYQLAFHVDSFVFLDDVNFIKRGFIQRNHLRLGHEGHRFVLPISNISQNRLINEHFFVDDGGRLMALIQTAYGKAPYFESVFPLVREVICQSDRNVARLAANSIVQVFEYLGIKKEFLFSSDLTIDKRLRGQERIISICRALGAGSYTNACSGIELYSKDVFAEAKITLDFIYMRDAPYGPKVSLYIPRLSMIDILMLCPIHEIHALLGNYDVK